MKKSNLKFKLYDKVDKCFCEISSFNFDQLGMASISFFNKNRKLVHAPLSEVELLQFSGMHDKNGREVYEGDIIKYQKKCWKNPFDRKSSYMEDRYDRIIFLVSEFMSEQSSFDWEGENLIHVSKSEVVGNIYENPELIEKIKADEPV